MSRIHPSAVISPEAQIHDTVEIGPGCVIEGAVTLHAGVRVLPNAYLRGPLVVGEETEIGVCASIGRPGQDFKFKPGMATAGVEIGPRCTLREYVTIHQATNEHTPTSLGESCYLMVGAHLGHDCKVGRNTVLCNNVLLGGHVIVGERVNFGGGAAVHQHARVGRLAMIGGGAAQRTDCPPFHMLNGNNSITGLNLVGLRRNGFGAEEIRVIRMVFRDLLRVSNSQEALLPRLDAIAETCPPVGEIADFIRGSKRGIAPYVHYSSRGARRTGSDDED